MTDKLRVYGSNAVAGFRLKVAVNFLLATCAILTGAATASTDWKPGACDTNTFNIWGLQGIGPVWAGDSSTGRRLLMDIETENAVAPGSPVGTSQLELYAATVAAMRVDHAKSLLAAAIPVAAAGDFLRIVNKFQETVPTYVDRGPECGPAVEWNLSLWNFAAPAASAGAAVLLTRTLEEILTRLNRPPQPTFTPMQKAVVSFALTNLIVGGATALGYANLSHLHDQYRQRVVEACNMGTGRRLLCSSDGLVDIASIVCMPGNHVNGCQSSVFDFLFNIEDRIQFGFSHGRLIYVDFHLWSSPLDRGTSMYRIWFPHINSHVLQKNSFSDFQYRIIRINSVTRAPEEEVATARYRPAFDLAFTTKAMSDFYVDHDSHEVYMLSGGGGADKMLAYSDLKHLRPGGFPTWTVRQTDKRFKHVVAWRGMVYLTTSSGRFYKCKNRCANPQSDLTYISGGGSVRFGRMAIYRKVNDANAYLAISRTSNGTWEGFVEVVESVNPRRGTVISDQCHPVNRMMNLLPLCPTPNGDWN